MSDTPDWLQQYADKQGWNPPEQPNPKDVDALQAYADSFSPQQPNPKDVAELQAYADSFSPQQPNPADIADLQGTAAALQAPSPIVDNDKPPQGQEDSGGHWETDDDGSRNWYVPPGAPGNPQAANMIEANPTQQGKGGKADLAFSIPESWTDKGKQAWDAVKQTTGVGGVANTAQQPETIFNPKNPTQMMQQELMAHVDGANKPPPYPEMGPKNPTDIDPTTGQPRKTAAADEELEPAQPQGHWVNGQWVRSVSPTALGMEGKLELNRGEHAADEADAARALSMQREQIYNQRSAELQAQADAARAEQARTTAARDKAEKDYDHASQLSAAAKVDPDRFWANKSTGSRVLATLGVALGAFGSAMTHTPNDALEMIKSAIDHDLEAQKVNAANAQKGTENAWQKLRAATGSAQQADNLYRVAALQTAQGQLDELNAGPQQRAGIDAALAQAKDQQQAKALQFRLMTEKYSPGYMVGGASAAGGAPTDNEKVVQLSHESIAGYAPNTRLSFSKKEDASTVTDQLQAYGIVKKARDAIANLEKQNPLEIYTPGSQAYDDAKQIRLQAVTQIGHLNGVKKLPIFDAEHMNDALDTHMYNAALGSSATHRMDTYLQNAKDAVDESITTRAPEVVRRHLDVNQRGEVTPGNHYTGEDIERKAMPKGFKAVGGTQGGAGLREAAPLQYKPEIRHVTETPGKGKKKGTETVTSTEPEEDEDER